MLLYGSFFTHISIASLYINVCIDFLKLINDMTNIV